MTYEYCPGCTNAGFGCTYLSSVATPYYNDSEVAITAAGGTMFTLRDQVSGNAMSLSYTYTFDAIDYVPHGISDDWGICERNMTAIDERRRSIADFASILAGTSNPDIASIIADNPDIASIIPSIPFITDNIGDSVLGADASNVDLSHILNEALGSAPTNINDAYAQYCEESRPYVSPLPLTSCVVAPNFGIPFITNNGDFAQQLIVNPSATETVHRFPLDPGDSGTNPRCYYANDDGKCSSGITLAPFGMGLQTMLRLGDRANSEVIAVVVLRPSANSSVVTVRDDVLSSGCVNISKTDALIFTFLDGTSFSYGGPDHYTDYFMNTATNTTRKFDFSSILACKNSHDGAVTLSYTFQDVSTLSHIAFDPDVSFRRAAPVRKNNNTLVVGLVAVVLVALVVAIALVVASYH